MKIILLIIINKQTNEIIWKNVILEKKMRERIIEFGVHMSEKYQLQISFLD
jgi:hypothetical protein